jgi:type IV secretion system protein VirD4
VTVYLVLPAEFQRSHAGLLRMWLGTLLRACIAGGATGRNPVRFVIDEAASLGRMQSVTDAVAIGRGYSINLLFIYQALGQLKVSFPDGQDTTFLSNMDCQVYFGPPTDWDTASRVSEMLGEATIQVPQVSGGTTSTKNRDPHGLESTSTARNDGWSVSETGRRLLRPEEILTMPERAALIFSRTTRPIVARLVRHYEPEFRDAPGLRPGRRRGALGRCLLFAAATFVLAALLAQALADRGRSPAPPPLPPATPAQYPHTPRPRW